MSPRFWWSASRTREPATSGGVEPEPGARISAELRTLATSGRSGALHVIGKPGGLAYVSGGFVVLVESWTTPGAEALLLQRALGPQRWGELLAAMHTSRGRDVAVERARDLLRREAVRPLEVELAVQRAVADAVHALLATDGAQVSRTRFLREERPWVTLSAPRAVDDLLQLALRHRARLARHLGSIGPDTPAVRARALPRTTVRFTATQWDLVTHADGRTPRDLAWLLGRSVIATTLEVARLEELGVLEPAAPQPLPEEARHAEG